MANKIGLSQNPMKRLAGLQSGTPETLRIKRLLWVYGRAFELEQSALLTARASGAVISGEWALLPASDCATLVLQSAARIGAKVADSRTMLRNWTARAIAAKAAREKAELPETFAEWAARFARPDTMHKKIFRNNP